MACKAHRKTGKTLRERGVSAVCHAPLTWNSGPMFFSVSGVAKLEPAREAEQRLVREMEADSLEREADTLERDREADRLARGWQWSAEA